MLMLQYKMHHLLFNIIEKKHRVNYALMSILYQNDLFPLTFLHCRHRVLDTNAVRLRDR